MVSTSFADLGQRRATAAGSFRRQTGDFFWLPRHCCNVRAGRSGAHGRRGFPGRRGSRSLRVGPLQSHEPGPEHSPEGCRCGGERQGHAPGGDNKPCSGAQDPFAQAAQAPSRFRSPSPWPDGRCVWLDRRGRR